MLYHPKTRLFAAMISHEQTLITKEHIAMDTNLILWFKPAQYSGTLVIKLFNSNIKKVLLIISQVLAITVTLQASLSL